MKRALQSTLLLACLDALEVARAPGLTQLAQRLGLDVADTLASDREHLSDFLGRAIALVRFRTASLVVLSLSLPVQVPH